MAKYRRKPVIVEAEQFLPDNEPWPEGVFLHDTHPDVFLYEHRGVRGNFYINTPEGGHTVTPGDYIIVNLDGEKHLCKENIFMREYEKAGE